jgi:hypothetical protein
MHINHSIFYNFPSVGTKVVKQQTHIPTYRGLGFPTKSRAETPQFGRDMVWSNNKHISSYVAILKQDISN